MPANVSVVLICLSDIEIPHTISVIDSNSSITMCYIQNATLLTFMPPFILIYMYIFELILISQLHPYENTEEKKAKH